MSYVSTRRRSIAGRRLARTVGAALVLGVALSAGSALADTFSMSPWVGAQLTKAREALSEKKYAEALKALKSTSERAKLSDHEKSVVAQTEGYVWATRENYPRTLKAFAKALEIGALPERSLQELRKNVGQLYLMEKQYKRALVHLIRWVAKTDKPTGKDYFMIASAYLQSGGNAGALKWARRAVASSKKPREVWIQTVAGVLFQQKSFRELPSVLEQLCTLYPSKDSYEQLFAVYATLKQHDKALAILELGYSQGFLTNESDIRNLAMLYVQSGVPLKGARVVEAAFKDNRLSKNAKNQELLSQCWLRARELGRAIDPLTALAKSSKSGQGYVDLAEVYIRQRKWDKAQGALEKAVAKGKLKDPSEAYLLLGIANFRQKKRSSAIAAFRKAQDDKSTRKAAQQWLKMIQETSDT